MEQSIVLIDNEHHQFDCSTCRAPLVDVVVRFPDKNIEWEIVAECCHCGGKSYQKRIYGSFDLGTNEHTEKYTHPIDIDLESNPIVIKTAKVSEYV